LVNENFGMFSFADLSNVDECVLLQHSKELSHIWKLRNFGMSPTYWSLPNVGKKIM